MPSVGGITAQSVQPPGEIPEEGRTEKKSLQIFLFNTFSLSSGLDSRDPSFICHQTSENKIKNFFTRTPKKTFFFGHPKKTSQTHSSTIRVSSLSTLV